MELSDVLLWEHKRFHLVSRLTGTFCPSAVSSFSAVNFNPSFAAHNLGQVYIYVAKCTIYLDT